ncbi:hypothetical protein CLU79DRAFT_771881 [Phycomyces nitens]|nr:hypothetical protein CLU79DRAFT_771881 [Phycomyces nitens]
MGVLRAASAKVFRCITPLADARFSLRAARRAVCRLMARAAVQRQLGSSGVDLKTNAIFFDISAYVHYCA